MPETIFFAKVFRFFCSSVFRLSCCLLFFSLFLSSSPAAFAQTPQTECPPECTIDSMEIVTWYPSPYNEYEELRLYPKFSADESECNSGDKLGLMYYNKDEQALKVCWQDPSDLSYSWEKIGSEQSGLLRLGNYATGSRPSCSSAILGALVYDTTEKRPYVCALNASNNPVWKPLDSDYDRDGVTDAVDYNDNDLNDATAVEANVEIGKTFYARGGSRRIGTMIANNLGGVCYTVYESWASNRWRGCSTLGSQIDCGGASEIAPDYYSGNPCRCLNGYVLGTWLTAIADGHGSNNNIYKCTK